MALLFFQWKRATLPVGNPMNQMKEKKDVLQGTLALMVLKTLDVLGPLHGYAVARRIEQISGDVLSVNQGTRLIRHVEIEPVYSERLLESFDCP
jgi:hypothetical protein